MCIDNTLHHRREMGKVGRGHIGMLPGIVQMAHREDVGQILIAFERRDFGLRHGAALQVQ